LLLDSAMQPRQTGLDLTQQCSVTVSPVCSHERCDCALQLQQQQLHAERCDI